MSIASSTATSRVRSVQPARLRHRPTSRVIALASAGRLEDVSGTPHGVDHRRPAGVDLPAPVRDVQLAHVRLPAEVAAAIAVVSQTATQMLELSKIQPGQTLLILGASGGVGSLAVQLAHHAGVPVIATARW